MKLHTFHVSGTHCASCKILIEDILQELDIVKNISVNLKNQTIDIETDSDKSNIEIAQILSEAVRLSGYTISVEKKSITKNNNDIWSALLLGFSFLIIFYLLQKSGILNFGIGGQVTPYTSFIIGLIASVSSCLAVVGGLILSLSVKLVKDNQKNNKMYFLFHIGRLLSFAILGGVLGLIGQTIGISFTLTAILGLVASAVMLLLGLDLVGVFSSSRITIPSGVFNFFRKIEHETYTPFLIGIGTFFLPCGFTQSMQVSALSSGSFVSGLLIMLSFALGTLPMLTLLSFGSASFANSKHAPLFFKSAGVVVIGLGLFGFLGGLAGLGIINPLFTI